MTARGRSPVAPRDRPVCAATAADSQPALSGFDAASGIAGESHLLPPLTGVAPKDPAKPHRITAKDHEWVRTLEIPRAGFSEWFAALPQPDRSRLEELTTAWELEEEERRDQRRLSRAQPKIRSLKQRYSSYVYFVKADGPESPVKIGLSNDPDTRVKTLQAASPERLYVIATMPGDAWVEKRLHERFAEGRLGGEWFRRDTPGLDDLIGDAMHFEGLPWDFRSQASLNVLAWLPGWDWASECAA